MPVSAGLRSLASLHVKLGQGVCAFAQLQVSLFHFFSRVVEAAFYHRPKGTAEIGRVVRKQILFTAVHALSLISMLALFVGTVIIGLSVFLMGPYIPIEKLHQIIIFVVMRELAPLVVLLIVIARSGTAIAAELVSMKVNCEIELLESLGIDVEFFIVLPRVIGMVVSVTCLVIYFSLVALLGGFLVTRAIGIGEGFNPFEIVTSISFPDIFICMLKALADGLVIALVCCFFGLDAPRDFRFIPIQATRGVVNTLITAIIVDVGISAVNILLFGPPQVL